MSKIIHKELSYAVRGVLLDVYNQLGPMLPEKFYQQAVEIGLLAHGLQCEREKSFTVTYRDVQVGLYYTDLWIEGGKLILELKSVPKLLTLHRAQGLSYLKVTDADLAILANFGEASLVDERLPNFLRDNVPQFSWHAQPITGDMLYPELTNQLSKTLHHVYFELGPGFFHHIYRRATMVALQGEGLGYNFIEQLPVYYRGHHLGDQESRLICVEGQILVATVAMNSIDESMKTKLKTIMKHQNLKLALLANFDRAQIEIAVIR